MPVGRDRHTVDIPLNLEEAEYLCHLMLTAESFRNLPHKFRSVHKDSYDARLIALHIKLSTIKTVLAARELGEKA